MKRKIKALGLGGLSLALLSACSTQQITKQPTTGWDSMVYFFANAIKFLSFGASIGLGIVLFTLIIRLILLPLFNMQIKSGQKNAGYSTGIEGFTD